MQISLKGTNLQILESTREYVDRKLVKTAEKYLKGSEDTVSLSVEVEKTTKHHKKSEDAFRAEATLRMGKVTLRAEAAAEKLNDAIDLVEEELGMEIKKFKDKRRTQMLKGARRVKGK